MENLGNLQCKNNIKVRGLRENAEGDDLVQFLEKLFSEWADLECKIINISAAFGVGAYRPLNINILRIYHITVKFPSWDSKAKVLEVYQSKSNLLQQGSVISIYSDLSSLTLSKKL